jgi:hypothetical protein
MNIKKSILCILPAISLAACVGTHPKLNEINSANYGQKPTTDKMILAVKNYMATRLIDPNSAVYECNEPRKSWVLAGAGREGNVNLNQMYYGYLSNCIINSKNRFGGYAGRKEYFFMIYPQNGGSALAHFDGFQSGAFVPE